MHSEDMNPERLRRIQSEAKLARIALAVLLFGIPAVLIVVNIVAGTGSVLHALAAIAFFIGAAAWWYWYWHHR